MHRCLRIQEIIHEISESISETPFFRCPKLGLARLARTCKTFYEPAMDVLWRDIQDIEVLLKCFPDDTWEIKEEHVRMNSFNQTISIRINNSSHSSSSPLSRRGSEDGLLPPPLPRINHNRQSDSVSSEFSASRRLCARCGLPMQDKFVRAMGKKFHLECFRCHV